MEEAIIDERAEARDSERVQLEDFRAYLPDHKYIFLPTRALWPASSVDSRLYWPIVGGKPMRPSAWLDQFRPVEQMTWAPGEPSLIENRLIDAGGWFEHAGCATFNLYRPPTLEHGDPRDVEPWLSHLKRVYPDDAERIVLWLAHRVQRPGEKINHALVLGGKQGIGRDTILEPVKHAVGPWNFEEVSPAAMLGRFNPFVRSVILRVSEARDLGDADRFAFYDHLKSYTAAPPDVLRCDEKYIREYPVLNVCGVVITTNHKADGIHLPADDRRHFVAWSEAEKTDFSENYWSHIWKWYERGGIANVAAFLAAIDLSAFDAKAPPPKTDAFWHIVNAARSPEESELADVLDALGNPPAVTLDMIVRQAGIRHPDFAEWLRDRKNRRRIPHRLEDVGYESVRNDIAKDGLWKIAGRRQAIYARSELSVRDRIAAAEKVMQ